MKNKINLFIFIIGLLAGIALASLNFSEESVKQKVKSLYELANPGTSIEIVSVKEESGIYKMFLKSSPSGDFIELFVTKDGKLLTQSIVLVEQSLSQLQNLKSFVGCLDSKGLKIYGLANQTATLLQLNLLSSYSLKIFIPCEPIETCLNAGIKEVPSVLFENTTYVGIQSISRLESITGCKFG